MELASVKVKVQGRVKGIGFRASVRVQARALRLSGYVRNLPDENAVVIEAEGERNKLEELVSYLRVGPSLARVTRVEADWSELSDDYDSIVAEYAKIRIPGFRPGKVPGNIIENRFQKVADPS